MFHDWWPVLEQSPALTYTIIGLTALVIGSFLNVVVYRLPRIMRAQFEHECAKYAGIEVDDKRETLSLAFPSSHCPNCGHTIRFWENVPVLSYVLLGGRCSACKQSIGIRYPLVEAATAILSVLVVMQFGLTIQGGLALILTWALIALFVIDLETQLLPDAITIPMIWIGLAISVPGWLTETDAAIIGAVVGYCSLWSVYQVFRLLTGKEGMGFGDFKLLAMFGAWLGWEALPQIVLLSSLVGAMFGGFLMLLGKMDRDKPMPFGPFLAAAGWISLMWGESINAAYMRFAGLA